MSKRSIPDHPPRIHLRNWLLASGDPSRDLALIDPGFSQEHTALATERSQCTAQIVTPSAALRQLLARYLLTLGLAVTEARPDLVLLDLAAPDALTHCRTLREQHPALPIVALIHFAADQQAAWEAGANAVLLIPFEALELHTCIRRLLQPAPSGLPVGGLSPR